MIADKLHVSTILSGSVRRQGNRARVGVQLINANDGGSLWSQIFDREVRDILAVEEEIARAVTGALKVELLGGTTQAASAGPLNPDAYNAYLQGRYFYERPARDTLVRAVEYFEQATKLQPDYAAAWLGLGEARISQADAGYVAVEPGYRAGREAIEKALALNAKLGEGHAALGWLKISQAWDWTGAEAPIQRALELEPNNAQVIRYAARLARARGRWDQAVALNQRGVGIDPLSSRIFHNLGLSYYYAGNQKAASSAVQRALELNPEMAIAHLSLAKIRLAEGNSKQGLEQALLEKHPAYGLLARALAYHAVGNHRESDAALGELVAQFSVEDAFQIAEAYAFRGEADRAFEWLERAREQRDPGFSEMKGDPLLKKLEADARYRPFLQKMGL
jgi:tetratricopeptide (TPR) repeat protein